MKRKCFCRKKIYSWPDKVSALCPLPKYIGDIVYYSREDDKEDEYNLIDEFEKIITQLDDLRNIVCDLCESVFEEMEKNCCQCDRCTSPDNG